MNAWGSHFFHRNVCLMAVVLAVGLPGFRALANSVSCLPPEGNALSPVQVVVDGFIGSNGPVSVNISGAFGGGYGTNRPIVINGPMPYFSGKHWVIASALVNGVNQQASNYFVVATAEATISQACGTNGTKVLITGNNFNRNGTVYVDTGVANANSNGVFAKEITINGSGTLNIVSQDGTHFVTNQFTVGTNICDAAVARATGGSGDNTIERPGQPPVPFFPGDPFNEGDIIRTGPNGSATLLFPDGTEFVIPKNSTLTLDEYVFNPADSSGSSFFNFLQGAFVYVSGLIGKEDPGNVGINTPMGALGIRGTEFIARRDPCSTTQEVYLLHGQLAITPTNSTVTNIVDGPATILFDATNVVTSALTTSNYWSLWSELTQSNSLTLGSWLVHYFGCTNGNPDATAEADADNDGQNNESEFRTRTDPTNSASVFRMVSAKPEGDGIRLTWRTHGGITNLVQAAAGLGGAFSDISSQVVIPGASDVITNYLHTGALTNSAAGYYRVRLAP